LGYQAVQAAHSAIGFQHEHPELAKIWHKTSNYLIFLTVADEPALEQLILSAEKKGIKYTVFREPDIDNQITAVTLEPSEASRKITSSLPLIGKGIGTI
jgi:hypothetical protein